jgi:hypothetical protein
MTPPSSLSDFARRLRLALPRSGPICDREFQAWALELHGLQFQRNPAYRQLCLARGSQPDGVKAWEEIPAVPTSAFKECELTSLPPADRTTIFHSSGTTGQVPSRHYHSPESLAVYEASLIAGFLTQGTPLTTPSRADRRVAAQALFATARPQFICLTPPPSEAPHSSLVHMFATLGRELPNAGVAFAGRLDADSGWVLDLPRVRAAFAEATAAARPVILTGTAFNYVHLLDALEADSVPGNLPPGSWAMETGGYKGRSRNIPKTELHAGLELKLGLARDRILCEYGMSELSSQAYDLAQPGGHEQGDGAPARTFAFPSWARARVVSTETGHEVADGEPGLIRIWDLANVWSVLCVQTEDLAVRRGSGFELLGRAPRAEPRGCSLMAR